MVVCDKCEECFHRDCLSKDKRIKQPEKGPWYCRRCRSHIIAHGPDDIIEDLPLLDFLFQGKEPAGADDEARVSMYSKICRAHG